MSSPITPKQPQAKIVAGPKSSPGRVTTRQAAVPPQDRIRERAYQLYESRGREPGQDEQDWFRAEQEILYGRGEQTTSTAKHASARGLEA
jgi:Protein of unknown function (DUF2934)